MNPETKRFEHLTQSPLGQLLRPDGTPVPSHWAVFKADEIVTIKNYDFKILHVGDDTLLLKPVGPHLIGGTVPR